MSRVPVNPNDKDHGPCFGRPEAIECKSQLRCLLILGLAKQDLKMAHRLKIDGLKGNRVPLDAVRVAASGGAEPCLSQR